MSSVVYIGVGQCGNQVLESFINHEFNSNRASYNYLQTPSEKLRCIFVDSESKVINRIKRQSAFKNHLREENLLSGASGRGNNWCYGYNGAISHPPLSDDVLEKVRKEVERCDNHIGIVMYHSLAGGTGSGFGSKFTEMVRDEFQLKQIMNCVVAPSDVGGDSPLQYYNSLLTLSNLNRCSDGVLLFHNDSLLNQLGLDLACPIKSVSQDYKTTQDSYPTLNRPLSCHQSRQISLAAINSLIASQSGSLFSPCSSLYPWKSSNSQINIELNEIIRSLCPFSDAKIIKCVSSNPNLTTNNDWNEVAKSAIRQLKAGYGNVYDTISSICCYRGSTKGDRHLPSLLKIQAELYSKMHFVEWNKSDAIDVWLDTNLNESNQITLSFNSGSIIHYLRYIKSLSMEKFDSSAYLHWYYKFGGDKELFIQSFEELEKIISQYNQMIY